jgi:hypothetical protein
MEAVLSLHVLVEPKHHPVQHEWVRAMRRLSPALKREVDVFAFAYRAYFPEFFFPPASGELSDFESELRRLRDVDEALVRMEFAIPLIGLQAGEGISRDPAALKAPGTIRRLRERAAASGDETLARQLLEDPRGLLERFLRLLESYWEEAFAREWERIEPDLAASVTQAGRVIAGRGLYALLRGLWPEVRADPGTARFWLERPHDHEVDIGAGDLLVLAPSVYVWPHVRGRAAAGARPAALRVAGGLRRRAGGHRRAVRARARRARHSHCPRRRAGHGQRVAAGLLPLQILTERTMA